MTTYSQPREIVIDAPLRNTIEALSIEYAWLIDHGRADEVAELFTSDAILDTGEQSAGIVAIRETLDKRAALDIRSQHVVSNVRLVAEAADRIRGTVAMTVYRRAGDQVGEAESVIVAESDDVYQRDAQGRWLFAQRRLVPRFLRTGT